nr:hypothetical protein [Mucilaginibacter sp. SP1R1]
MSEPIVYLFYYNQCIANRDISEDITVLEITSRTPLLTISKE